MKIPSFLCKSSLNLRAEPKIFILQKSKYAVRPREINFILEKVEEGPYWDRLLATKVKQPWLRIDFKNWKDEDDDEEEGQGQDLGKIFSLKFSATDSCILWLFINISFFHKYQPSILTKQIIFIHINYFQSTQDSFKIHTILSFKANALTINILCAISLILRLSGLRISF